VILDPELVAYRQQQREARHHDVQQVHARRGAQVVRQGGNLHVRDDDDQPFRQLVAASAIQQQDAQNC